MPQCPKHPEKQKFSTFEYADFRLGVIWRKGRGKRLPSRVYECNAEKGGCGGFHHTKKPKGQMERYEA